MEPLPLNALFSPISLLLTTVAFLFYLYLKFVVYNYWTQVGVLHESPSVPFGNVPLSYFKGDTIHGSLIKETYLKFRKFRFCGLYILWEPILQINDPELIRQILVKNFNQFSGRGRFVDEHKDPLTVNLVRMSGERWKRLRAKVSPTFTSGKLKLMYPLIEEICGKFVNSLDTALDESNEIEMKGFASRYTVDCISSIVYGFNLDSLHNSESLFLKYGESSSYLGRFFILVTFFVPQLGKFAPLPEKRKLNAKFFSDFFVNMVEHRRKENIYRNDMLNMFMQLIDYGTIEEGTTNSLNKVTEVDKITMTEAIAQSYSFFSAGQESTTLAITCCLFELSLNPEIQQKLYEEIYEAHESLDGLTYDSIFRLQYLDMVFQETFRKYPGTSILTRMCNEDFEVPDSNYTIRKGMRVVIPLAGLHADPDVYPEPEKFDPTRFTPENIAKRHNFAYLPFGDGPRKCIAQRISMLKVKMALYHLVLNYIFSPCEKTPDSIEFLPDHSINVVPKVMLKVEKRKLR